MYQIKQPSKIIIGKNSSRTFDYLDDSLIITSSGARKRGWLDYLKIKNFMIYDDVESNPSMNTVETIFEKFENEKISNIIGLGGGSCLDVAKFVAKKLKKQKILIPTTFGSGSEVTRISVLKIDNKKQSFHGDDLFADIAIIDSYFIENTPENIFKNSVIDSIAQCSEGFDSKNGNYYTKFLCNHAFELLEDGVLNMNNEKIVLGSLVSGLGFGNCSTTLGHALSYVFSKLVLNHHTIYYQGNYEFLYYFILITHILLSIIVLPLALFSMYRGMTGEFQKHKKIVKWTLPIWLYVTFTGVLVYIFMSPYY